MIATRFAQIASIALSCGLAACSTFGGSSSSASDSGSFSSLFKNPFAQSATPSSVLVVDDQKIDCPTATIRDGGAVLRNGKGQAVATQLTIRNVVRECRPDGLGVTVKIGIEGIAVIGAAGKPGPVSGPITITVDRDDKVIATRAVAVKTTIGADGQALFSIVEDGLKIPPGDGETVINVGFKN